MVLKKADGLFRYHIKGLAVVYLTSIKYYCFEQAEQNLTTGLNKIDYFTLFCVDASLIILDFPCLKANMFSFRIILTKTDRDGQF